MQYSSYPDAENSIILFGGANQTISKLTKLPSALGGGGAQQKAN